MMFLWLFLNKFWYFADRATQYTYLNINQLDALIFYNKFINNINY